MSFLEDLLSAEAVAPPFNSKRSEDPSHNAGALVTDASATPETGPGHGKAIPQDAKPYRP